MKRVNTEERRLLDLLNAPVNRNKCGECKAHDPTWASWNLGVFLCGRCASAHRSLGTDISRVKSLSMEHWSRYELDILQEIGNKRNNVFWNEKNIPFPFDGDDKDVLIMWLRNKYTGKFKYSQVLESDYRLSDSAADPTDDYGFDKRSSNRYNYGVSNNSTGNTSGGVTRSMRRTMTGANRSDRYDSDYDDYSSRRSGSSTGRTAYTSHNSSRYSSSTPPPSDRIIFRKPTNSEFHKYGDQSRRMKYNMGYEDENLIVEALVITRGNIDKAARLIEQSGGSKKIHSSESISNAVSNNSAPSLPARKTTTGSIFDSTKTSGFNWLGGEDSTQVPANDTQIYQYVDPVSGAFYYIDASGQQYMDPNQQQSQLQMQQQQQQQQQALMMQNGMNTGMIMQQQPTMIMQNQFPAAQTGLEINQQSGREPTLNEIAQQQQMQQQQMMMIQQQQQQQQMQQQPNYFSGF